MFLPAVRLQGRRRDPVRATQNGGIWEIGLWWVPNVRVLRLEDRGHKRFNGFEWQGGLNDRSWFRFRDHREAGSRVHDTGRSNYGMVCDQNCQGLIIQLQLVLWLGVVVLSVSLVVEDIQF